LPQASPAASLASPPSLLFHVMSAIIPVVQSTELKWWHVRWKRLGLALLIAFGSLCAIYVIVTLTTDQLWFWLPWYQARQASHSAANLDLTPQILPDKSVASIDELTIKQFDFSFQVPWKHVSREVDGRLVSLLSFNEGASVLVQNPTEETSSVTIFRGDNPKENELARRIYGTRALSSNYELLAAELSAKPSDVHWWTSRERNIRSSVLLNIKASELELAHANAIFWQGNAEMRGFQFGNPAVAPFRVELVFFDRADRRYQVELNGPDPPRQFLTQAEVNAIVASMKPIPYPANPKP
jgi:hypothetical protein